MIEHLVVSTVVLALAMLAARALPVTARTRHAILLCGLAKFAIPSSLFTAIGVRTVDVLPTPALMQGVAATAAPAAERQTDWLLIAWAAIAALSFARWLLLRARTIAAALRSPAPPSPRELEALAAVRRSLGLRTAVDLIRSPLCEAPAVLRVIRPVIILPARGCDDLNEDELRALLLHELAHVARRDNLTAILAAFTSSLLWFHPLVWLAVRQLDAAREQACDERVAEAMQQTEPYLEALTKVCRAVLAPRTAGASCMAGANVKQRMENLMRYETLKQRAWSHRGVLAMAVVAMIATAVFAAETPFENRNLYSLGFSITPGERMVLFHVNVIDNATGAVVSTPRVSTPWGVAATVTSDHAGRKIELRMQMRPGAPAELHLVVREGDKVVQRNVYTWEPRPLEEKKPSDPEFSGQPISLNLQDADIVDVMNAFAGMTGTKIKVHPAVTGTVTLQVTGMPWDEAMTKAAQQVGAKIVVEGKTVHITK